MAGNEKKLSFAVSGWSVLGWSLLLVGFIVIIVDQNLDDVHVSFPPYIVFLAGAPCPFVLKLCYAGNRYPVVSSIIECFAAFSGIFVLASAGYVFIHAISMVTSPTSTIAYAYYFTATGSLIYIHCWCVNLILSALYKDYSTKELDANVESRLHKKLFQGRARKLAVIPNILLVLGWILIIIGAIPSLVKCSCSTPDCNCITVIDGRFWGVAYFGLPTVVLLMVHAGSLGTSTRTLGVVTAYLATIYMVFVGAFLYSSASSNGILFAGSLISCFCMACLLSLWPFYQRLGSWTLFPVIHPLD